MSIQEGRERGEKVKGGRKVKEWWVRKRTEKRREEVKEGTLSKGGGREPG